MRITAYTDIGFRHDDNEDTYLAGRLPDGTGWIVMCDGMGGVSAGKEAGHFVSGYLSAAVKEAFLSKDPSESTEDFMLKWARACNRELCKISVDRNNRVTMGTTLVFMICDKDGLAKVLHAGDSRAYHLTETSITRITCDHSMVQELLNSGKLTEEEARNHPHKNIITSALGVEREPKMDVDTVQLEPGDSILICSDGLSNTLTDEEILEIKNNSNFYDSADLMVRLAVRRQVMDNVTAVLFEA